MKRVAVIGGGPAGAFTAERLARAGVHTVVIDEKLAWEKPCGGGLTYKAYSKYPFLIDNHSPKKLVARTRITAGRAGSFQLELTRPIVIYSRYELNRMLLERAALAGAQVEKTRVTAVERCGCGWTVATRDGRIEADHCILAAGARNPIRDLGTQLSPPDTMMALGYYVPCERDRIDLSFFPGFAGYIWVFPRDGHLSVGIGGKGVPAAELRRRLEAYMAEHGLPVRGSRFYAHLLPALESGSWRRNRVAGEGWTAVGDAAGLVDPITGEGLYYALRSADLAAETIVAGAGSAAQQAAAYRAALDNDFIRDLEFGARLAKRLFQGTFLGGSVPDRMVQLLRRSATYRDIVQDLFAGTQGYLDLKARLLDSMRGAFRDLLIGGLPLRRAYRDCSPAIE